MKKITLLRAPESGATRTGRLLASVDAQNNQETHQTSAALIVADDGEVLVQQKLWTLNPGDGARWSMSIRDSLHNEVASGYAELEKNAWRQAEATLRSKGYIR